MSAAIVVNFICIAVGRRVRAPGCWHSRASPSLVLPPTSLARDVMHGAAIPGGCLP